MEKVDSKKVVLFFSLIAIISAISVILGLGFNSSTLPAILSLSNLGIALFVIWSILRRKKDPLKAHPSPVGPFPENKVRRVSKRSSKKKSKRKSRKKSRR